MKNLNLRPADYKSAALPTELIQHIVFLPRVPSLMLFIFFPSLSRGLLSPRLLSTLLCGFWENIGKI